MRLVVALGEILVEFSMNLFQAPASALAGGPRGHSLLPDELGVPMAVCAADLAHVCVVGEPTFDD